MRTRRRVVRRRLRGRMELRECRDFKLVKGTPCGTYWNFRVLLFEQVIDWP
jgi:hypothetical protein